jgi:hypothetical protein
MASQARKTLVGILAAGCIAVGVVGAGQAFAASGATSTESSAGTYGDGGGTDGSTRRTGGDARDGTTDDRDCPREGSGTDSGDSSGGLERRVLVHNGQLTAGRPHEQGHRGGCGPPVPLRVLYPALVGRPQAVAPYSLTLRSPNRLHVRTSNSGPSPASMSTR